MPVRLLTGKRDGTTDTLRSWGIHVSSRIWQEERALGTCSALEPYQSVLDVSKQCDAVDTVVYGTAALKSHMLLGKVGGGREKEIYGYKFKN